jgi:hypothetical protein
MIRDFNDPEKKILRSAQLNSSCKERVNFNLAMPDGNSGLSA